jgi:hypothetical protein
MGRGFLDAGQTRIVDAALSQRGARFSAKTAACDPSAKDLSRTDPSQKDRKAAFSQKTRPLRK